MHKLCSTRESVAGYSICVAGAATSYERSCSQTEELAVVPMNWRLLCRDATKHPQVL